MYCIMLCCAPPQVHCTALYCTASYYTVLYHALCCAPQVRTSDLEIFLSDYSMGGIPPFVRWVDDNHALGVFPSADAAQTLLESTQRTYKVGRLRFWF